MECAPSGGSPESLLRPVGTVASLAIDADHPSIDAMNWTSIPRCPCLHNAFQYAIPCPTDASRRMARLEATVPSRLNGDDLGLAAVPAGKV